MKTKKKTAIILLTAGLCVSAISGYIYADDYDGGNSNIFCVGQAYRHCSTVIGQGCSFYIPGSTGRISCFFPDRKPNESPQEIITEEGSKDPVPSN